MADIGEKNIDQVSSLVVDLKPELKQDDSKWCGSTNEIKHLIIKIKTVKRNEIIERLNQPYKLETEVFGNFMKEFASFLINDQYSIKKDDFKLYVLPRLLKTGDDNPKIQLCAVQLLERILLNDWKLQSAKLTLIAIKASLIPQLIKLYDSNSDTETRQSIYRLYLLLLFVIANDYKKVRKLVLDTDYLLTQIIRNLNETNDSILIKDALLLFQFFPIWSKNFETIRPILSSLIKFIKHNDKSIVSQSLYSLLIFSQNCKDARIEVIRSSICGRITDLLLSCDSVHSNPDEDVVKPIMGLLMTFLPLSNRYKDEFLNSNILSIVDKYAVSCQCHRRYASDIIKFICMTPICSKLDKTTKQIQQVIENKKILPILGLLENDYNLHVKFSALNAIFVTAFKSTIDQLKQLADQGCLKSLCTQLESLDYKYLNQVLLTIIVFLLTELKDILKNKKIFPAPGKSLTDFAKIIMENDGIRKLKLIVDREKQILEKDPNNEKSKNIRITAEDMLFHAFGIETRSADRQPSVEIMKSKKSFIDCMTCNAASADTMLFPCEHVVLCHKCAAKALLKIYSSENINECLCCKEKINFYDAPWALFKGKPFLIYKEIEDQIVYEFE